MGDELPCHWYLAGNLSVDACLGLLGKKDIVTHMDYAIMTRPSRG